METKKQTKIDEYDDKEIVEEKDIEKTKTSQIKKLKSVSKIINEMLIELEPKPQSKSDESIPKDKSNFGFKPQEKKFNFGSKHKENKPSFGSKSTGIKTIPVTSTKLQPAWKPKQE